MQPLPTQTVAPAQDSATRELQTPEQEQGVTNTTDVQEQPQASNPFPTIPQSWQLALAAIAALCGLVMVLMRQAAASRWRQK
jgi:hypothetical protein